MLKVIQNVKESLKSLEGSPNELYFNFILKFCDSYNYFAVSQIIVIYLHNEFQFSDLQAGGLYGLWGAAITLYGLLTSPLNDNYGVKKSLMLGFSINICATFILSVTRSAAIVCFVLLFLLPLANSMGIPMLTVGIKRYTTSKNRGFAFGLFYSVMNIGAMVSGPVVDAFNIGLKDGFTILGLHFTGNRLVILSASFISIISLLITTFCIREIELDDTGGDEVYSVDECSSVAIGDVASSAPSIHAEDTSASTDAEASISTNNSINNTTNSSTGTSNINEYKIDTKGFIETAKELCVSKTFWRFSAFTLLLINLKTVFRHLDATLPTYLIRCFSTNVPKGTIYSINPFLIIFLTPIIAATTSKYKHFDMIKYGGYITAVSPFFIACSTSVWATCCFIVLLSIGEAIWSPRTYDYTMSIATKGREASFSQLATAPLFVAKVPVGLLSGYLISKYIPADGDKNPQMLWLIIGLVTLSSPILITIFEKYIREPDDSSSTGNGNGNIIGNGDISDDVTSLLEMTVPSKHGHTSTSNPMGSMQMSRNRFTILPSNDDDVDVSVNIHDDEDDDDDNDVDDEEDV